MIKENYVNFETAKLLKKKGFDEQTVRCYNLKKELCVCQCIGDETINSTPNYLIAAPTLQMAMKWLREVHNVNIEIHYNRFGENYKYLIIYKPEVLDDIRSLCVFYSYEEACEAAINYCLENLI